MHLDRRVGACVFFCFALERGPTITKRVRGATREGEGVRRGSFAAEECAGGGGCPWLRLRDHCGAGVHGHGAPSAAHSNGVAYGHLSLELRAITPLSMLSQGFVAFTTS